MAYRTTAAYIRQAANLPDVIEDDYITPHLDAAQRRLIAWVGEDVYDQAVADELTALEQAAMKDAETFLAISYAMPSWSQRIGPQGQASSGRDGDSSWSLVTPNQVAEQAAWFLQRAENALIDVGLLAGVSFAGVHKVGTLDLADEEDE